MKGIFGLSIYGCIFENTCDTSLYPFLFRGKGISSIDCNFFLHKYCNAPNTNPCNDLDTCKFLKLDYGIKALNSISKLSFSIEECIFRNNLVGISLSGIDYVDIISNEFKCPKTVKHVDPQHFIGGLFMEGCSGYHVENNNFYAYDQGETGNPPSVGIGIKNSGPDHNEIYNNYFTKLHAGIYAIGENKGDSAGLCLKCNDMSQNINDFIVVEDENHQYGVMQGIYQYQGHPKDSTSVNAPAGNRFTGNFPSPLDTNNIKYFSYLNDAEAIFYIHHFSEDFQVKPIKNHYTEETVYLIERSSIEFVKDSACPSGLEGENNLKIFTSPYTLIAEADDQIAILKDQLFSSIDGGNTEELNFEIMISIPEDAFEIRQELLNESPFLSDTVMKQAIIKENVLPNAMIRDILTVNPQSAKSDKVLKALNTRYEPMPDYMMDQIMEGQKRLGSKELLEAQIQSWQQVRAKAKSSLFRQFLNDTNLVNQADSIINFLTNENEPNSKYYLALLYWNIGDTVEAFETLNALPGQFYLTNDQLLTHQQYQDYFNILKRMADSIWTASDLDSVAIQTLFELKDNGASGISACARGMLVKGGFLNYIETIPLIQLSNSVEYLVANKDGIKIESTKDYLKVFPNPAGKYTIAFYDIAPDHQSIILELINDLGMVIEIYYLDSGEN